MDEIKTTEVGIDDVEKIIKQKIYLIRGHKVMLDFDIADLYQIETRILIQAVTRNKNRFPDDFAFQLDSEGWASLRSQIEISKKGRGGRRYSPYVFTEHGVAMLSSVLNSEVAIQMNILIIRIFIKIKEWTLSNEELKVRIGEVERKQEEHGGLLNNIKDVVVQLIEEPVKTKKKIGFNVKT